LYCFGGRKNIGEKAARKILVKLPNGDNCCMRKSSFPFLACSYSLEDDKVVEEKEKKNSKKSFGRGSVDAVPLLCTSSNALFKSQPYLISYGDTKF